MDADLEVIWDELDDIELGPGDRRTKAEELEGRVADEPGSRRWAEFLVVASDHRLMLEEYAVAIAELEQVRAAGVMVEPSIEAHLLNAHLVAGNQAETAELDRELRAQSREVHLGEDYTWIAECYEEASRHKDALRWFTMAIRDVDPDDDLSGLERHALLGRYRVRQALGLPHDAYDVRAELVLDQPD